jgi:hypothetical protein
MLSSCDVKDKRHESPRRALSLTTGCPERALMAKTSKTRGFEKLNDPEKYLVAGPGGATHQTAEAAQASLTTNQGVIVARPSRC